MKRALILAGLLVMAILIVSGCGSSDPETPEPVLNEVVYEGLNMQIPFITGIYQMSIGPFDVREYSEIRVYAFGNSGSGIIHVTVASTDDVGDNHGVLDDFDLNFSATYYATGVYDLPGEYIRVYLQSTNPCYASVIVYGRTSKGLDRLGETQVGQ